MQTRPTKTVFATLTSEGALLPPDLLQRVADEDRNLPGLRPTDYHLLPHEKLGEAVNRSWNRLVGAWVALGEALARPENAPHLARLTRERWLLPLFQELGYGTLQPTAPIVIGEKTYPVSHRWGHALVHLVPWDQELDRRTTLPGGGTASAPHSLIQELLNRSEDHLWAFVSNGRRLRVLRDNRSLTRQAYVEFDLETLFTGQQYADFKLLWMICHQSRLEGERPPDCLLERWTQEADKLGKRALDALRDGVEAAITALGQGFLEHPANATLRESLQQPGGLDRQDYYRQLLRIVYRLLFLFVAEDRRTEAGRPLLLDPTADDAAVKRYLDHYSTTRLREMAGRFRGTPHGDLWRVLRLVFDRLHADGCPELALPALGSFLWSPEAVGSLAGCELSNRGLLAAVRELAYTVDQNTLRPIDYRNLGSEELGSVYESLLELHPELNVPQRTFRVRTAAGNERKTTGSYYTPKELIRCLLDSALDPVVDDTLTRARAEGRNLEQALLAIKVCDPACGSGHFLVAAAERLAKRLAALRTGDEEPGTTELQHARRAVIGRCLYGVDINPMTVELCKVALWMEALEPGKPLTFLEAHVQCGNSLLGATPRLLADGIPDDAFKPIEGDDKKVCAELKKRNKRERKDYQDRQGYLFEPYILLGNMATEFARLATAGDDSIGDLHAKEAEYAKLVSNANYQNARLLADTWCSAFVWKKDDGDLGQLCPTERVFRAIERNPHGAPPAVRDEVQRLSQQYQLFHWHLAFPDVFRLPAEHQEPENEPCGWDGGFDVVLGNPPWEKIKLEEKEWFASSRPDVAKASGAKRKCLIASLEHTDPELFTSYKDAIRKAEGLGHSFRDTGLFPLCSTGDINSFAVFVELMTDRTNMKGRVGCVVPSGIATDNTTRFFLQKLVNEQMLSAFYDFWNRKQLFRGVQPKLKFCMLSISRQPVSAMSIAAQLEEPSTLRDPECVYTLTRDEVIRLNPNTQNLPTFANSRAARLAIAMQMANPVLVLEAHKAVENPYSVDFFTLFHSTNDSDKFHTHDELVSAGGHLDGNIFINETERFVPVLEAKLVHQFNHRASTFQPRSTPDMFKIHAGTDAIEPKALNQPYNSIIPRYWMSERNAAERRKEKVNDEWLVGFRRTISAVADARSVVFTVLPPCATTDSLFMMKFEHGAKSASSLIGAFNSFAFDFVARQKASGGNLSFYVFKQLPVPGPERLYPRESFLLPRVLELTCTAWDLEAFALDCGYDGPPFRWDEDRRFLLRCELDAAYFHLYLGSLEEWGANSPELTAMFPTPRDAVDYIMDTFPIVRRKDEARYNGEYRTKTTILALYDAMAHAIRTGQPYQTQLDPPPGPPTAGLPTWQPGQPRPENWPSHIHPPRGVREAAPPVVVPVLELSEEMLNAYVQALLHEWAVPVARAAVEKALLLMINDDLRAAVLGNESIDGLRVTRLPDLDDFLGRLKEHRHIRVDETNTQQLLSRGTAAPTLDSLVPDDRNRAIEAKRAVELIGEDASRVAFVGTIDGPTATLVS